MYDEIMRAAQIVAQSVETNNNRITILESELNKEKIKKTGNKTTANLFI